MRHSPGCDANRPDRCPHSYGTGYEVSGGLRSAWVLEKEKGTPQSICQRTRHASRIERLENYDVGTTLSVPSSAHGLFGGGELSVRFQEVLRNSRLVQTSPMHWHTGGRPLENISPLLLTSRIDTSDRLGDLRIWDFWDISYFLPPGVKLRGDRVVTGFRYWRLAIPVDTSIWSWAFS